MTAPASPTPSASPDPVTWEGLTEPLVTHGAADDVRLPDSSVDLVVTSPPYWRKRDYGIEGQLGQEATPALYADALVECLREWRRVLRRTGTVFLNVGDTWHKRSLAGVPALVEQAAAAYGWQIRNRIVWAKTRGNPDPVTNRLTSRYEYVLHLSRPGAYFYDLVGYSLTFGTGANPGDVWSFNPDRSLAPHLAPFPEELVERAVTLGCPTEVCPSCGAPSRRIVERTADLDPERPQARRAMELAKAAGLTAEHYAAIRATGISDAGKAQSTQTGTGKNRPEVARLAAEAKAALGGYFREFTLGRQVTTGWTRCDCGAEPIPGTVLDPFAGTGTTVAVARRMGRFAHGFDLAASRSVWEQRHG